MLERRGRRGKERRLGVIGTEEVRRSEERRIRLEIEQKQIATVAVVPMRWRCSTGHVDLVSLELSDARIWIEVIDFLCADTTSETKKSEVKDNHRLQTLLWL